MNDTIKSILNRRSTRVFAKAQLKEEDINLLIDCGLNAPSAVNTQNWHFTIVQNAEIIGQINDDVKKLLPKKYQEQMINRNDGNENFSIFYHAPTVIVVSGEINEKWAVINCSLATENICIAAESLGVATCIIGFAAMAFDSDEGDKYKSLLAVPNGYKPLYAIAVGYKAIEMKNVKRLAGRVTRL